MMMGSVSGNGQEDMKIKIINPITTKICWDMQGHLQRNLTHLQMSAYANDCSPLSPVSELLLTRQLQLSLWTDMLTVVSFLCKNILFMEEVNNYTNIQTLDILLTSNLVLLLAAFPLQTMCKVWFHCSFFLF